MGGPLPARACMGLGVARPASIAPGCSNFGIVLRPLRPRVPRSRLPAASRLQFPQERPGSSPRLGSGSIQAHTGWFRRVLSTGPSSRWGRLLRTNSSSPPASARAPVGSASRGRKPALSLGSWQPPVPPTTRVSTPCRPHRGQGVWGLGVGRPLLTARGHAGQDDPGSGFGRHSDHRARWPPATGQAVLFAGSLALHWTQALLGRKPAPDGIPSNHGPSRGHLPRHTRRPLRGHLQAWGPGALSRRFSPAHQDGGHAGSGLDSGNQELTSVSFRGRPTARQLAPMAGLPSRAEPPSRETVIPAGLGSSQTDRPGVSSVSALQAVPAQRRPRSIRTVG